MKEQNVEKIKRIYVVIPRVVDGPNEQSIVQPLGRQVAQACHVTNEMRSAEKFTKVATTIILQARDIKELDHICFAAHKDGIKSYYFLDENPEYGPGRRITALCLEPIEEWRSERILGYLPLWPYPSVGENNV